MSALRLLYTLKTKIDVLFEALLIAVLFWALVSAVQVPCPDSAHPIPGVCRRGLMATHIHGLAIKFTPLSHDGLHMRLGASYMIGDEGTEGEDAPEISF